MQSLIDLKSHSLNITMNILLKDRTTNKNIIFATDEYNNVDFTTPITKKIIFNNSIDIRPRVEKSLEEQNKRTRKKAEVFTPSWLCNKMNNHCDTEWFGYEDVFNIEKENDWTSNIAKINFPKGKSWKDYVISKRLEITCGEAPYLVSRYDTVTGQIIPIEKRIGILDRKLRVINENVETRKVWNQWVYRAFESVYGYEYRGDNLLIARINLLETFCEYMRERWNEEPSDSELKRIANIISWNLWQMDGIQGVIPHKGDILENKDENNESYQLDMFNMIDSIDESEKEDIKEVLETIDCKIYDWFDKKLIICKNIREELNMKFNFVIGNPPYQDETLGENEGFAPPVYNKFLESAYKIADKVEMIHPARFLFNAGSTPKSWNKLMLEDKHLKIIYYEADSSKVFSNTDIKGGVVISYRDLNSDFGAIEIFTPDKRLNDILRKVKENNHFQSMSDIVITRTAYRLTQKVHEDFPSAVLQLSKGHLYDMSSNIFERLPQIFFDDKPENNFEYMKILGRENKLRKYKYIRKDYVKKTVNTDSFKVVLPKASGKGTFGEIISNPFVDVPNHGSTETFITIGNFVEQKLAENALKYIKTKFARTMLGILKRTQEITPEKWKWVPLQNFSDESDIDWSQSISDIDKQLYKKYNLSDEEIEFIETNVKEME